MKHILLISNLDGHSVPLLRYASRMCHAGNMKLHILQIEKDSDPLLLSSPYYYNQTGLGIDSKIADKHKAFESFVTENTKDLIETEWLSNNLMKGNIEYCLKSFINDEKIDLVLVRQAIFKNTHIHHNHLFQKILLNISDIPLLVIPQNQLFKQNKNLCFFTAFSEYDFNNIKWITQNFPGLNISLIHFSDAENTLKEKKWLDYLHAEIPKKKIELNYIQSDINTFIKENINIENPAHDLLSLSTKKRNFWQRIVDPATTIKLVSDIEIPCLIFKE